MRAMRICYWLDEVGHEEKRLVGEIAAKLGALAHLGIPIIPGFIVILRGKEAAMGLTRESGEEIVKFYQELPYYDNLFHGGLWQKLKVFLSKGREQELVMVYSDQSSSKGSFVVKGEANVIEICKRTIARAKGLVQSLLIQKYLEGDLSGVMLTRTPVSEDKTKIYLKTDELSPSVYVIDKESFEVFKKSEAGSVLARDWLVKLGEYGRRIEKHFYFPQRIEWLISGGKIYVISSKEL